MITSRRDFIKKSALACAGTSILSHSLFAAKSKNELLGVQLYCVRDEMKSDPLGTLQQLAHIGYKNVEHANCVDRRFYGYTVNEFKKVLDDLGMKVPSGHTELKPEHWNDVKKDFTDAWKFAVEDAAVLGQKFVISYWSDEGSMKSYDDVRKQIDIFNKSGELCKKSGMKFGYHNHGLEFSQKHNGKTVYDIILQHTDPSVVTQQLDIGNLYNGGAKAIDIVRQYPGRFESMHVKDEIIATGGHEKYDSTILGQGIVNVKEVIDLGRKSGGTIHFIVEQESYQGKTPLECMKEDYNIMKKWGY